MEPTMAVEGSGSEGIKAVAGPVVQIYEGLIQAHLDEVVRPTVEETLNALLDAEVDRLCGARKYERSEGHKTRVSLCPSERKRTQSVEVPFAGA
jgi:hypothetical protein